MQQEIPSFHHHILITNEKETKLLRIPSMHVLAPLSNPVERFSDFVQDAFRFVRMYRGLFTPRGSGFF